MSTPTQEGIGVPAQPTATSTEARLSKLETVILQLGQSVQLIMEDMKSLKSSALFGFETVQEGKQMQESDTNTSWQQQKEIPTVQQKEINKLLDAIPSDGVYHSSAIGGAIPKVSSDNNHQKTSTPLRSPCHFLHL
jgi:hypothetical protein